MSNVIPTIVLMIIKISLPSRTHHIAFCLHIWQMSWWFLLLHQCVHLTHLTSMKMKGKIYQMQYQSRKSSRYILQQDFSMNSQFILSDYLTKFIWQYWSPWPARKFKNRWRFSSPKFNINEVQPMSKLSFTLSEFYHSINWQLFSEQGCENGWIQMQVMIIVI